MNKPLAYAKQEIAAGRHPSIIIEPGEFGTFWLHDGDWKMLDAPAYLSREAAAKARSKIIEKAYKACDAA